MRHLASTEVDAVLGLTVDHRVAFQLDTWCNVLAAVLSDSRARSPRG